MDDDRTKSFCDEPSVVTSPPSKVLDLWNKVGQTLDDGMTVVWKEAVQCLQCAIKCIGFSSEARHFVDTYTGPLVTKILDTGLFELSYVKDAIELTMKLIAEDLRIQIRRGLLAESLLLETALTVVFNQKKYLYTGGALSIHRVPESYIRAVKQFWIEGGFRVLVQYMEDKVLYQQYYNKRLHKLQLMESPTLVSLIPPSLLFPELHVLSLILRALHDGLDSFSSTGTVSQQAIPFGANQASDGRDIPQSSYTSIAEDDAVAVAEVVMKYLVNIGEGELTLLRTEEVSAVVKDDLRRVFHRLISTRPEIVRRFYVSWRDLALKLVLSESITMNRFGWEQIQEIFSASAALAPAPHQYLVKGAGCPLVNGIYEYAGDIGPDGFGYALEGTTVKYVRTVPLHEAPCIESSNPALGYASLDTVVASGHYSGTHECKSFKKITLFRCALISQRYRWFISEADEEQPGTDRDIDYYQHKHNANDSFLPPWTGWSTCHTAGINPPPTLEPVGVMAPPGMEHETFNHELARWVIENKLVERALEGPCVHWDVVEKASFLKFLGSMSGSNNEVLQANQQIQSDQATTTRNVRRRVDLESDRSQFNILERKSDSSGKLEH